jgi:DHA1 family tetracycline resistance protein-like MFS transporter
VRVVDVDAGTRGPADRIPRQIWVLVGAAFLIAIGYGLVAPTLPVFVRSFDVGITAASLVISVFALSRLLFAPVSGGVVGRFGELPAFASGLTIVAVTTGACAFAGEYWHLLVLRGLGGIGSTMFTVSSLSLLIRLAPVALRGRASGMWSTGFLLGNVIGPLVGGGLVVVSLRAPFLVYGAVLLVVAGVGTLLLRGGRRTGTGTGASGPPARFRDALRHPTYRAALVSSFAQGWAVFGVRAALVPLFVVEALHQPEAWSGVALAVFAAGNAATLVFSGRIADRRGRRPPVLAGLAVASVATAALGFVTPPPLFLAVSLVAGMGSGLVNPPMNAAVADVIGSRARGGTVLAGFQMAADLGAIVGPLLAGLLAESAGFPAAFVVTGAVTLLALVFWLGAPETLPRSPAAPSAHAAEDSIAGCAVAEDPAPRRP